MRSIVVAAGLFGAFGSSLLDGVGSQADEIAANPYVGKSTAIDEGRQIYRSKCISCHGRAGGRGPNLFESGISDHGFASIVLNGRSGTVMPAFRARLSEDDVFKLRAFIESTDHY
jgi:mono/diheme cytochrome c family protein